MTEGAVEMMNGWQRNVVAGAMGWQARRQAAAAGPRRMVARFPGTCKACGKAIHVGDSITWSKTDGAKHQTSLQCEQAAAIERPAAVQLDVAGIVRFITAARDRGGLKAPKLRVLAPNGTSEIRLSLTRSGHNPGSVAVVVGGEYVGLVTPDGDVRGRLERGEHAALRAHLVAVAEQPADAAKRYAAFTARCSFCNLELTDDGSVEVGYGPVCAKKWGLPHAPKGAPKLAVAS